MTHVNHIPERIIVGVGLEYAGLGQCSCGLVADLVNWRAGKWPRTKRPNPTFCIMWELEEDVWREPDEAEKEILIATSENLLADTLWPEGFRL